MGAAGCEALSRRGFLGSLALVAAGAAPGGETGRHVMTVLGPIEPGELGVCLPHEHILVDFIGADRATPDRYDAAAVAAVARPHLARIGQQGVRALVECTPAYLGRDPLLLKRLATETGLHLLTNTGYYAANGGKHLPAHVAEETAEELAARWIREAREGIDGSGVRPGFIKIGYDGGPLNDAARKLVAAAGLTHRATGLAIAAHSGDGTAALEGLEILTGLSVPASAFIWVHAQNEADPARHRAAARRGAYVEFDGLAPDSVDAHVRAVTQLAGSGSLDRILVSHDAGWYHVGEPGGGTFRPFDTLMESFVPALRKSGFTTEQVDRLLRANPREAFTIKPA